MKLEFKIITELLIIKLLLNQQYSTFLKHTNSITILLQHSFYEKWNYKQCYFNRKLTLIITHASGQEISKLEDEMLLFILLKLNNGY